MGELLRCPSLHAERPVDQKTQEHRKGEALSRGFVRMAVATKMVSTGLHPQLVKLLEADASCHQYTATSKQNRPCTHHLSYTYFILSRAALRHLCALKTLLFLSFLFIIAWGCVSQRMPYASAAWEKSVLQSSQRQGGGQITVLVTGAAGFVGSHVALALKKRGDGVVGLDNFNDYYPVELKRERAANLDQAGIFIAEGDLNDQRLLAKLFDLVHFTHVLHLAAQAGVRYAVKNPLAYVHSNVGGFVTLLEQCKNTNPQPAIVYASSSSVYGLNSKVPFSEDDRTDHPASLYAATKKADEVLAHTYNHIYGLSITALRFFTVYGPWGRPDMAYFSFTRNIVEGKPITIFQGPHGEELARDFTFIDDIVKGCVASLDTTLPSTGSGGRKRTKAQFRIFNLGNTKPVKVGDFVSILEKHLKKKAIRKIIPMPSTGDVMFTHANVTRAKIDLGYNPTTDLNTGLQLFVKWYKSYYKEGSGHGDMLQGYRPY